MSTNTSQRSAASRKRLETLEAEAQKRKRRTVGLSAGATVLIVVVALVVTRLVVGHSTAAAAPRTSGATVSQQVSAVPASVVNTVGAGSGVTPPSALSGAALTSGGRPEVVYVGAEYCPYCAAERWAVVQALSRFGTFTNLGETSSDPSDIYPNTATLSFHGATYTSNYLSFQGIEQTDNKRQPLDSTPADVQALLTKADPDGTIPFVDLGGTSLVSGAEYSPQLLSGLTQAQIAADLTNPDSPVTKAIVGAANSITKRLCTLTGNQPASACTAAGVSAAA